MIKKVNTCYDLLNGLTFTNKSAAELKNKLIKNNRTMLATRRLRQSSRLLSFNTPKSFGTVSTHTR